MSNPIQDAVLKACRHFMIPIARFLLRNGVGYREFAEISKLAFVQVASDEYGIRGRKTNMSRVAVMTGLTRKEVRSVREALDTGNITKYEPVSRPERLLELWSNNPKYRTRTGRIRDIKFGGEADPPTAPTFVNLVREVGGDIPPGALLKELTRAGSVRVAGSKLRLVSVSFLPQPSDPEALRIWGRVLSDLASTINYNHTCSDPTDKLLERQIYFDNLSEELAADFEMMAQARGKELLQELDQWVTERQQKEGRSRRPSRRRVGLGLYSVWDEA